VLNADVVLTVMPSTGDLLMIASLTKGHSDVTDRPLILDADRPHVSCKASSINVPVISSNRAREFKHGA